MDATQIRYIHSIWLRGQDLNLRPSGYEPDELPTAPPRDISFSWRFLAMGTRYCDSRCALAAWPSVTLASLANGWRTTAPPRDMVALFIAQEVLYRISIENATPFFGFFDFFEKVARPGATFFVFAVENRERRRAEKRKIDEFMSNISTPTGEWLYKIRGQKRENGSTSTKTPCRKYSQQNGDFRAHVQK